MPWIGVPPEALQSVHRADRRNFGKESAFLMELFGPHSEALRRRTLPAPWLTRNCEWRIA